MKKTLFIKNAIILTVCSLILRFAGIIFKVWLAKLVGSEGIGLYQLIFSVYMLASTFATSGISTAVTRLCAEELALGTKKSTLKILKRAISLTVAIALLSVIIIFSFSNFIAERLLGDGRAALALKILPLSLPFMGVSSCLRGYFISRRKVSPGALTQIAEQGIRIVTVVLLVTKFISKGLAVTCGAVIAGDVISEAIACFIIYLSFLSDKKRLSGLSGRERPPFGIVKRITSIALPITSGRYLNSLLRTGENILVPKALSKFSSGSNALSQFGMIKGMALPILFFPSALLNSISTLLIPEMSEAAAKRQMGILKYATQNILRLTAIVSFIFTAVFFVSGEIIGNFIYKEEGVGLLLKYLSPIVPLMYLDSISDGILKGLDQQNFSFKTSISDSLIRIVLILAVLPRFGLAGFIGIMYFSNLLTCFLNVKRLIKITRAGIKPLTDLILPLATAFTVTLLCSTLLGLLRLSNILVYIILLCGTSISLYFVILLFLGVVSVDQIKQLFK